MCDVIDRTDRRYRDLSKIVTGITLDSEDVKTLEAYKEDLCRRHAMDGNVSHAIRNMIRNPKDYVAWLTRHDAENKKQERSAKSDA